VATASPTIGNLTVSSVGNIAVTATLAKTIGTLSLDATGKVIASASLDATLDPITAAAGLVIGGGDDVAVPWWWAAYVARHQAERRLAEQQARIKWLRDHTVHGDGWAVMPVPIARGALLHDPDADAADFVAALLPWLVAA
jgi:hypothetical protein